MASPNKFRKLNKPATLTPPKKSFDETVINLEYSMNRKTQETSDNMRLAVVLKAGLKRTLKNPKGFVESAWNGANLCERVWLVLQRPLRPLLARILSQFCHLASQVSWRLQLPHGPHLGTGQAADCSAVRGNRRRRQKGHAFRIQGKLHCNVCSTDAQGQARHQCDSDRGEDHSQWEDIPVWPSTVLGFTGLKWASSDMEKR